METALSLLNSETALAACRGDAALARRLTEQYRASLPAERAALEQAGKATPPDWETVREQAHRLQSGGAYLGAERIAAAARNLEAGILARDPADALVQVQRTLDAALQEFLSAPIHN